MEKKILSTCGIAFLLVVTSFVSCQPDDPKQSGPYYPAMEWELHPQWDGEYDGHPVWTGAL